MVSKTFTFESDGFEIGNVYTRRTTNNNPTYYVAISKKTLLSYIDGQFGKYSLKKEDHSSVAISVFELREKWNLSIEEFDSNISRYFQPDDEAKARVRKEKLEEA